MDKNQTQESSFKPVGHSRYGDGSVGLKAGQLCGMAGVVVLVGLISCATFPPAETFRRFEFTQPQMGVPFRIVLYAPDQAAADFAAAAAFKRIAQLNDIMSDYEMDSELSQLSRTAGEGKAIKVSNDLWKVLELAQELAFRTEGAFDVTVGPYTTLWRRARREKRFPPETRLSEARKAVGWEKLQLDPAHRTATLLAPGMRLDLGGIAKGYAVDEALAVLRGHGIESALVAGSGDIAVSKPPPGRKDWRIEIPALDVTNAPPKKRVLLSNAAIATSGDLSQRLEIEGKRYSHIIDPRTGLGLTDHSLVTVIARNCITADSSATAVSVLGPSKGIALVNETPGAAVHIIRSSDVGMERVESRCFKKFYENSAP